MAAGDVGVPQVPTVGTREAGMFFDRFVLSTDATLTSAQLDALAHSGAKPVAPKLKRAVGSATLDTVTMTFTRPLQVATVVKANFTRRGKVGVAAAELDAASSASWLARRNR